MNRSFWPVILSVVFLIAVWQTAAILINNPVLFPTVGELLIQITGLFKDLSFYSALFATIYRGLTGFACALFLAITLSAISANSLFWKRFFQPIIVIIRSVPVISVVLMALIWFSPEQLPVFIALLTMFPILYQSATTGFEQVDKRLVEMATLFGKSKIRIFLTIYIPSAKNQIFGGISTATGFGWRAIIIGEVLSQPLHGIGTGMKMAQVYLNISELFAWTIVAVLVSYLFDSIIRQLSKVRIRFGNGTSQKHKPQNTKDKKLVLNNISIAFEDKQIISHQNFQFDSDIVYLLKAPSGKGKTSLLRLIAGQLLPVTGSVNCIQIHTKAFSYQDTRLCSWLTAAENIAYAGEERLNKHFYITEIFGQVTEKLEITDILNKYPNELSGGQKQRVALARALVAKADLLLLDEPLNGLDDALKIRIMNYLNDYISIYKPLVVWATHENIELPGHKTRIITI